MFWLIPLLAVGLSTSHPISTRPCEECTDISASSYACIFENRELRIKFMHHNEEREFRCHAEDTLKNVLPFPNVSEFAALVLDQTASFHNEMLRLEQILRNKYHIPAKLNNAPLKFKTDEKETLYNELPSAKFFHKVYTMNFFYRTTPQGNYQFKCNMTDPDESRLIFPGSSIFIRTLLDKVPEALQKGLEIVYNSGLVGPYSVDEFLCKVGRSTTECDNEMIRSSIEVRF